MRRAIRASQLVVGQEKLEVPRVFYSRQCPSAEICSYEHENTITPFLVVHITQALWETSTDGIESMESRLKTLKAALEAIRDTAVGALDQVGQSQECSMRWKCKGCRYIKHFTVPVTLETAGRCPRCKSTEFRPIL